MSSRRSGPPIALACAIAAAGCAHHQHQTKIATAPTPTAPAAATTTAAAPPARASAVSPDLSASQRLVAQCRLDLGNQVQAPKFDFDQFELLPQDRDVLQQIATCVTTGPLAGHTLHLVGRADPRGTDEYNLGLGTRRAHAVATYLEQLGVHVAQVSETTRGALDATGRDDAGWRVDRRVDLDLAN